MATDSKEKTGVLLTLISDGYHPRKFRVASCHITDPVEALDAAGHKVSMEVPRWYDFEADKPQRVEDPKDYAYFKSLTIVVTQKSEFDGVPGTARQVPMFLLGAPKVVSPDVMKAQKEDKLGALLQYLEESGLPLDEMATVLNEGGNIRDYLTKNPTEDEPMGDL